MTYGYGSEEELANAGVDFLCRTPHTVVDCLLRLAALQAGDH